MNCCLPPVTLSPSPLIASAGCSEWLLFWMQLLLSCRDKLKIAAESSDHSSLSHFFSVCLLPCVLSSAHIKDTIFCSRKPSLFNLIVVCWVPSSVRKHRRSRLPLEICTSVQHPSSTVRLSVHALFVLFLSPGKEHLWHWGFVHSGKLKLF